VSWITEHVTEALLGIVMALMAFLGKRALERIDDLDERKADKDDISTLLRQLERHIEDDKELRREVSRNFHEFGQQLSEVRVSVAKIAGQLDRP
jgi:septation ring formation regulator EzrA